MALTAEARKEEFQKYLEKNGVIDSLTKVLVGLYEAPEKPPSAIDYIKEYLGAPVGVDVDKLKKTIEDLQKQLEEKDRLIADLQKQLAAKGADAPSS
jgi:organic radical activating enzyme